MLFSYKEHKNETYLQPDGTPLSNEAILQQQKMLEAKNRMIVRDEFLIQLQKFTSQISRTIKQIEGYFKFFIILIPVDVILGNVAHVSGRKVQNDLGVCKVLEWEGPSSNFLD